MRHREYGRIEYRPRLRVWRVIAYHYSLGPRWAVKGQHALSDHPTYQAAADALQAYVREASGRRLGDGNAR
jgi:hypothetical protein